MKIKAKREQPFVKISEVFELDKDACLRISNPTGECNYYSKGEVRLMMLGGWFEEVVEDELEEKIEKNMRDQGLVCSYKTSEIACLAREHIREKVEAAIRGVVSINYCNRCQRMEKLILEAIGGKDEN